MRASLAFDQVDAAWEEFARAFQGYDFARLYSGPLAARQSEARRLLAIVDSTRAAVAGCRHRHAHRPRQLRAFDQVAAQLREIL